MIDASQVAPTLRAVTLHCYREAARLVGLDPHAMLRRFDLAPDLLEDPENRLPARAVLQLVEASAAQSGCQSFGLLLAACRDLSSLGPVSLLLRHVDDVRAVIESMIEYQRRLNDLLDMALTVEAGEAVWRWNFREDFGTRQYLETSTGIAYRALIEASAGGWFPEAVRFRHEAPADTRHHRRFFKCRIEFESDVDALVFDARLLEVANPQADRALAHHARQLLGLLPVSPIASVAERARSAIRMLIAMGDVGIVKVATNLDLQERRLQRLLEEEGTSYAQLLSEVRRELALRALDQSGYPITAIADQLGYSCVTSFTRWFTREFGQSPRSWRRSRRGGGGGQ